MAGDLNNLFVKGFPEDTTEEELHEAFQSFGIIKSLSVVKGRGFGYVSFETPLQAEDAIIGMRERPFKGKTLVIEVYENKKGHLAGGIMKAQSQQEPIVQPIVPVDDSAKKIVVRGVANVFSDKVRKVYEKYGKIVDFTFNNHKGKAIITYDKDTSAGLAIE
jgi:RNA recognition motif-containing protein